MKQSEIWLIDLDPTIRNQKKIAHQAAEIPITCKMKATSID